MYSEFTATQLDALRARYLHAPTTGGAAFAGLISICTDGALRQLGDAGINRISRAARTALRQRYRTAVR